MLDAAIDEQLVNGTAPDASIIAVLARANQPLPSIRANVKLAISGGQNEPRDAIAGTAWALLSHPDQFARISNGLSGYLDAFLEYARWQSPIGMSPRRITCDTTIRGVTVRAEARAFLMFGINDIYNGVPVDRIAARYARIVEI